MLLVMLSPVLLVLSVFFVVFFVDFFFLDSPFAIAPRADTSTRAVPLPRQRALLRPSAVPVVAGVVGSALYLLLVLLALLFNPAVSATVSTAERCCARRTSARPPRRWPRARPTAATRCRSQLAAPAGETKTPPFLDLS